jgi:hypothetical protein
MLRLGKRLDAHVPGIITRRRLGDFFLFAVASVELVLLVFLTNLRGRRLGLPEIIH